LRSRSTESINRRETREEVSYIDIVVFGKQARTAASISIKGDAALIEGRLQQRRWTTRDGAKRSKVEVAAQSVTFMPKRHQPARGR